MHESVGMVVYLVLRASNLEASRNFYEQLGLDFTAEQHGGGPVHYATASTSTVLELYPAGRLPPTRRLRFGIRVSDAVLDGLTRAGRLEPGATVIRDPDDNEVDLLV